MTYLPEPGHFEYCNTILEGIRSGAKVLLGRQQWSIGRILYLFQQKKSWDLLGFYRNLTSMTSPDAGASVKTRLALGFGFML
jgi:hypothetical protein